MSATKQWYPHYIEKYRRKTGHLTLLEHGAYRLLMDAYWDARGPLPADETRLRKLIRADKDEWEQVRDAVLAFFTLTDEGWRHAVIDEILADSEIKYAAKRERIANARAAKAAKNKPDNEPENSGGDSVISTENKPDGDTPLQRPSPLPSPSHSPDGDGKREEPSARRAARAPEEARLPALEEKKAAGLSKWDQLKTEFGVRQ